ncbi:hypothetical protein RchiOBHm_Chr1g0330131 [Rosa chinensis]|uniref:Uncharacterized protein n=1 Tax=Rosa chinensis TaxID=74649 RepID=A0A2P6SBB3_ROSCH|nr:hypothetical protein RchiOBHm_Chr1g0330131 [Rosa chinensis]
MASSSGISNGIHIYVSHDIFSYNQFCCFCFQARLVLGFSWQFCAYFYRYGISAPLVKLSLPVFVFF